jgi:hypothetical protein
MRHENMKNPWLKKNPLLSIWLSGANAVAGSVRGRAQAEARRAVNKGLKQAADLWTGGLLAQPPKRRKKRR